MRPALPASPALSFPGAPSTTYVGPNRWFDQGDRRFAPDNVIISSRTNISSAQRLPNGNALITAGAGGRVFEVTAQVQGAVTLARPQRVPAGCAPT